MTQTSKVSARTARSIDQEIRTIIDRNYQRSKEILVREMDKLHTMAEALLQYETISLGQIDDIMAGRPVRPPEDDDSGAKPTGGTGGATTGALSSQAPGLDPRPFAIPPHPMATGPG